MSPNASAQLPEQAVHVVIVNYGTAGDVADRLRSPAVRDQHVIVVDNASEPAEIEALCRDTGADCLLLADNLGFAGGVNTAVATIEADARPILLLNPDAAPSRADLARLYDELRSTGVDGVAPLLVEPSGRLQVGAAGGPLSAWSAVVYFGFLAHLLPWLKGLFWTRRQAQRGGRAQWLCAACLLVRPDAFARFGPLPEDEIVYAEDVAWGTAASAAGAEFRLLAEVRVPHAVGASGASSAWSAALMRLYRRRLGVVRAGVAVTAIRSGLRVRRLLGRRVA